MIAEGGAKLHFVDDRFETVKAIAADSHLSAMPRFQTYFATWCAAACLSKKVSARTGQRLRSTGQGRGQGQGSMRMS